MEIYVIYASSAMAMGCSRFFNMPNIPEPIPLVDLDCA